jgi:REP element-mobilizing transposase RayT
MPRRKRIHVPGGIYHVILRGNAHDPIFFLDEDHLRFNDLIQESLDRYESRLHAFCWMTNHIHAAIQVSETPLSYLMCWLASRYSRYLNKRRKRTGHVFERRHRAFLVTDNAYLLCLVRYIHLNPVGAGLAENPEEYRWSSHRSYCGMRSLEWVTTRAVLSCFADSVLAARREYRKFMIADHNWMPTCEEPPCDAADHSLMTDELVMPMGSRQNKDQMNRILTELVEQCCESHDLRPAALFHSGRRRHPARVRALISHHAISNGIATLTELAVYFRRAPEVIARGIQRYCSDQYNSLKK